MIITIKELYESAKAIGKENLPIGITYSCSDDWYDIFNNEIESIDFGSKICTLITSDETKEIKIEEVE